MTDDLAAITGQPFWKPCIICSGFGTIKKHDPEVHRMVSVNCPRCEGIGMHPRVRYGYPGDEGK